MRLVSAYVTGFGRFVKCKIDLSQNIVQIKEDNGFGKTTLADFLECMFYGMDEGRKKSVAENFRVKYKPWNGESFGGTLTFSAGGKTYRLERTFGKTPSFDTAKIYDETNKPTFAFGDKAERLGETLFGVDRESYRRSVYLPQGEINPAGFSGDIKGKLTALLTADSGKTGQKDALTLLDEAERALRSKRVPKTGKLDVIDARLAALENTRLALEESARAAKELRLCAEEQAKRLAAAQKEWRQVDETLAAYTGRKERAANADLQKEIQNTLENAARQLEVLNGFFGSTPPSEVNLQGLSTAVDEYYALRENVEALQARLRRAEEAAIQKEKALSELTACEKNLESYQSLLSSQKKTKGADTRTRKEERKKAGKKGGYALIGVCLFLATLLLGLTQIESQPALGFGASAVGVLGLLVSMRSFWKNTLPFSQKAEDGFADKELNTAYKAAQEAFVEAQRTYRALCEKQKEDGEVQAEYERKTARMQSLETAVKNFLSHFRFEQMYDYRAAADTVRRNVEEHARYAAVLREYTQKLAALPKLDNAEPPVDEAEFARLKVRRERLEEEKRAAAEAHSRCLAQAEEREREGAKLAEHIAEEERLKVEKTRLENRLLSVRTARELILRTRANMASQYLVPVQNACKRYAASLGFTNAEKWRFTADSLPLAEENGALKETDYYSAGMRGLWDLCIRLALVETLFQKETPALIFDDPLRDFDDGKTEKGKLLIKELSRRYQIVYCTCKQERML